MSITTGERVSVGEVKARIAALAGRRERNGQEAQQLAEERTAIGRNPTPEQRRRLAEIVDRLDCLNANDHILSNRLAELKAQTEGMKREYIGLQANVYRLEQNYQVYMFLEEPIRQHCEQLEEIVLTARPLPHDILRAVRSLAAYGHQLRDVARKITEMKRRIEEIDQDQEVTG